MPDNFLSRSSAEAHVGCFHALAAANGAAMSSAARGSFSVLVSQGTCSAVGLYGGLIPSYLMNLHPVLYSDCISVRGFPFLHTLSRHITQL